MKFSLKLLALLPAITFCTFSCSKTCNKSVAKNSKQEIAINIETDPTTLDVRKARLLADYNILRSLNDGLYRVGKDGVTTKAIADSLEISADKCTYTITLKETLWSNGEPLTAHDFIYSWKSSLDKNFASPSANFLFPIKNAAAIKEGLLPASLLGARAQDDYTLVIELEKPTPYFTELLAQTIYYPVNESYTKENPSWASDPNLYICNGPFRIDSWKHNNELLLEKNENYWDKNQVKLQKLSMIMLDQDTALSLYENKELQLVGSPYSKIPMEAIPKLNDEHRVIKGDFLGTYWICTNTNSFPLQNTNFRKSLASSINRKDIIEHILYNTADVATSIVPPSLGIQGAAPSFTDGDTDGAKKLFKLALKELSVSKRNLPTLTLTYKATGNSNQVAAVIQDQWKQVLGIDLVLEPLEAKVYIDRVSKGDYQLAIGSWIADFKDPINFLEVFKTKSVGTNNTGWESLNYISAIESSYEKMDEEVRKEALIATEKILLDDMPVIPVYHYNMIHLQDENLKDVVLSETGSIDFKWAYVSN